MTMRVYIPLCALLLVTTRLTAAQQIDLGSLDKLAALATSKTEVTLDSSMLQTSAGFLSAGKSDEASVKKILSEVKGIYVRVFEFDETDVYSDADLKPIRDQLRGSQWKTIVSSHEEKESVDIMMRQEGGGDTTGLIIIASEPKEIAIINIVGKVNLQDLAALGGNFGIPKVESKKTPKQ
jgi:hypothetical protein